ncbi:putative alkyl hydroperoxide reductase/ Thiol specific antioxidant/ Mal allergen [Toxoplasma gondii TgCatPRC2]|uniref:Peroxiredoxin n=15 Tax=Toxoplasma gondii TaxID=5811 RepID=A0A0F7V741_TOXGV|nr:alkyl hydroperoxide reductase/ Thiol specific antioxidant/ Mal allergen, putative [Toxoplasma gondii ME49]AAG25678.2 peroxiredoxin [Toxoplasma gondii]EPR63775.1 putative alkyl hydroperoxide reductase/ Thiol specific antioxidant/ Mal allergen [Toxoplasma gondii GT1]ESS34065.1 putative alkyl hydroperoxide reductase/ Thiol specific antioxidant/ Mal allergen [Toxoplasma gondii VEG]KFG37660.1 putative alkyl hydroperoxide reductase/ Thiol specific antioxidant/ Mal allergen [Toxoplasma gondii p89]|eukprot:XP_002371356.1 alkyl hydroperoxide reductase/ Thiol specific antioxidant/ Mal allergen, putative [Toxoplasma gondii ME49]
MPAPMVSQPAPAFEAEAVMADGSFGKISLSQFKGKKYVVLFFYPFDFTFVCPSEILAFHRLHGEFEKRGCQLLGVSVDSKFVHNAWRNVELKDGGIGKISFPLLADVSHKMAEDYGVLHPEGMAFRGLFLIDKEGVLQHCVINNLPLGRSADEALRMLDALQHVEQYGEVCPANWKKGDKAMKPTAEGVKEYLGSK